MQPSSGPLPRNLFCTQHFHRDSRTERIDHRAQRILQILVELHALFPIHYEEEILIISASAHRTLHRTTKLP